jgi:hypothetical protein
VEHNDAGEIVDEPACIAEAPDKINVFADTQRGIKAVAECLSSHKQTGTWHERHGRPGANDGIKGPAIEG